MTQGSSRLITTGEAASHCQVSLPAIRSWIRDGRLKALRTPGGHARVEVGEFQRFLAKYGMSPYPESRPTVAPEPRVLLVEDDPDLLDTLTRVLSSYPQPLVVETAIDGYDALIRVGTFRPSVLILDVVMPKLDGVEVCRRLRASRETRDIKILAITGHTGMIRPVLAAGADACLTKPLDFEVVEKELGRLLASLEAIRP